MIVRESRERIKRAMATLIGVLSSQDPDHFEKRILLNQIRRARDDLTEAERIFQQEIAGG